MKKFSTTNTVGLSDGTRITRSQLETRIREGKRQKLDEFAMNHGYHFCEDCNSNGSNNRLDVSHEESVDSCIKNGRAEKAYDVENMKIRCRPCHQSYDGNGVNLNFIKD